MSTNDIKVLTAISKEFSRRFDASADLLMCVNRQYDKPHTAFGANSGSTIQIKKPQKLTAVESSTLDIQDVVEETASLDVSNDVRVGLGFTAEALTQDLLNPSNLKMFGDDYLQAAIDTIITTVQKNCATYMYQNIGDSVGTAGVGPTSYQIFTQARAKLNKGRAPKRDRYFALDPDNAALLNNGQVSLFNPVGQISANYNDGALSPSNGFMCVESNDLVNHTNGAGASYVVNGAGQTGATVTVGTGTGIITKGTSITFAGCFDVDPVDGAAKTTLKQFVVNTEYAGGAGNIAITPSIVTTGAYKTCSASPTDTGAVTINGAASGVFGQGLAFHRDAYVFGTAELADIGVKYEVPIITGGAGDGYSRGKGSQKGLYMKMYMDGDITNRRAVASLDMRWGISTLVDGYATRIQGA